MDPERPDGRRPQPGGRAILELRVTPGGPRRRAEGKVFEDLALPILDDLYRLACRFERDPHRAQDLLQEALLRGLRKSAQLKDPRAFRAWMSAIVRRDVRGRSRACRAMIA